MPDVLDRISRFPRTALAHSPTPLEAMPNLANSLDVPGAWVKRDDCTGMAFGGNKVRQLEYYFGAAQAEDADTVLITGAVQSNFVRSTAAAAAKLGLDCHAQLEHRTPKDDPAYTSSGNVLLDRMLGATLHHFPVGEDEAGADRALDTLADNLRAQGRRPYVIHLSAGHPPLGALGYIHCAQELIAETVEKGITIDAYVVGSGSGATHGGLLFGLRALGDTTPVIGICVRRDATLQRPRIIARCAEVATLLDMPNPVSDADVITDDTVLAPGYGQLNKATEDAITTFARTEALLLDPVYSGKCAAGLVAHARTRQYGETLCFIHTGGGPGIFAYAPDLLSFV